MAHHAFERMSLDLATTWTFRLYHAIQIALQKQCQICCYAAACCNTEDQLNDGKHLWLTLITARDRRRRLEGWRRVGVHISVTAHRELLQLLGCPLCGAQLQRGCMAGADAFMACPVSAALERPMEARQGMPYPWLPLVVGTHINMTALQRGTPYALCHAITHCLSRDGLPACFQASLPQQLGLYADKYIT